MNARCSRESTTAGGRQATPGTAEHWIQHGRQQQQIKQEQHHTQQQQLPATADLPATRSFCYKPNFNKSFCDHFPK
jgi:hypothetical protein